MIIKDRKRNLTIDLISPNCLHRDCYIPQISFYEDNIKYVCGCRVLHGCPDQFCPDQFCFENDKKQGGIKC